MRIDIVTIFPGIFPPILQCSILKRAQAAGAVDIRVHDLRDWTTDKRRTVDDRPYGGGAGMIMKPEPIFKAVERIERDCHPPSQEVPHAGRELRRGSAPIRGADCQIVLMAPTGVKLDQAAARDLSTRSHIVIICGHYEGVDERVRQALVDREISIGDYVLTGGELPAMVLVDCVVRLIPGVLGHQDAHEEESFVNGLLEYPQYTRPPVFQGMAVPEVLRTGDHEQIASWRNLQAVARTMTRRPDLTTRNIR